MDELLTLIHGDCIDVMARMQPNSVDAVVTDPPYGMEFMNKDWDRAAGFQSWTQQWATEALRVLKPGGHLLAFGGTRTFHRLTVAIEDAGFEIRDSIAWLYSSGFPKSHDVSIALDRAAGAERPVTGPNPRAVKQTGQALTAAHGWRNPHEVLTGPATEEARRWQGWGTALKPAHEPIIVARKPLAGTVAANVTRYGTGALNIDATRVPSSADVGRWPPNVAIDDLAAQMLDDQSGVLTSGKAATGGHVRGKPTGINVIYGGGKGLWTEAGSAGVLHSDSGGASRFFPNFPSTADLEQLDLEHLPGMRYQAKAPPAERPTVEGVKHATVKPLALMRWLVTLVTPPTGIVLDPFVGSGTTAEACVLEGFRCIAIEREDSYLPLVQARMERL